MNIFIAIWEDRHTDTTAHAFSNSEKAIEFARKHAKAYAGDTDFYKEEVNDGWVFYAVYSSEVDCIRVVEVELDKDEKS